MRLPVLPLVLALAACSQAPAPVPAPSSEPNVVGLGEIMGLNQMRHEKLWFAGQAENWPLAAYEIDELREGFDDARRFHDHHKGVPQPLSQMIPAYIDQPLEGLSRAVEAKDKAHFTQFFDQLTDGCNGCHRAAQFGFNVIRRPTTPPFSNQDFAPPATSAR